METEQKGKNGKFYLVETDSEIKKSGNVETRKNDKKKDKLGLSWAKLSCIGARIYLSQIYFYLIRFSYG